MFILELGQEIKHSSVAAAHYVEEETGQCVIVRQIDFQLLHKAYVWDTLCSNPKACTYFFQLENKLKGW